MIMPSEDNILEVNQFQKSDKRPFIFMQILNV